MSAPATNGSRSKERGYALLFAIFLVASMLLVAAAAAPSVLTEGRRLREQEAIWRGKQYMRAIRLYYQKNGKYPASLEDLAKANAAGVHFLRKAYKDPMNSADGTWRLIYVTPTGQLVGSVHYHSLQEMAIASAFAGQMPGGASGFASQVFGQVNPAGTASSAFGSNTSPGSSQQNGSQLQTSGAPAGANSQNPQGSMFSSTQPAPLEAVDSPVFGGSVIGVAGKVKQRSTIVYEGGKTYFEWEFIWNPLMNGTGGAPGQQTAIPGLNAPTGTGGQQPNPAATPNNPGGATPAPGQETLPGSIPNLPQNGNPGVTSPMQPGSSPQN